MSNTENKGALSRREVVRLAGGLVAAPAILRVIPANAQSAAIKIGWSARRPGRSRRFGEADDVHSRAGRQGGRAGDRQQRQDLSDPGHRQGQPVQLEPRRRSRVRTDPRRKGRSDPRRRHARRHQSRSRIRPRPTKCRASPPIAPWQPYFFGRKGDPKKGFDWTYHFFWGLEDVIAVFTTLWNSVPTNKSRRRPVPQRRRRQRLGRSRSSASPKPLKAGGFNLVDPGRYQPLSPDFSAQIAAFKKANVEIVTGVMIPPDFATFWSQAAQQGFKPKIATIGKALLFPSAVSALGDRGDGLSSEIWWSPSHPFKSSLTGQTAKRIVRRLHRGDRQALDAADRLHARPVRGRDRRAEARQEPEGSRSDPRGDRRDQPRIRSSARSVGHGAGEERLEDAVGRGQWTKTANGYDLVICENATAPKIPVGGKLRILG